MQGPISLCQDRANPSCSTNQQIRHSARARRGSRSRFIARGTGTTTSTTASAGPVNPMRSSTASSTSASMRLATRIGRCVGCRDRCRWGDNSSWFWGSVARFGCFGSEVWFLKFLRLWSRRFLRLWLWTSFWPFLASSMALSTSSRSRTSAAPCTRRLCRLRFRNSRRLIRCSSSGSSLRQLFRTKLGTLCICLRLQSSNLSSLVLFPRQPLLLRFNSLLIPKKFNQRCRRLGFFVRWHGRVDGCKSGLSESFKEFLVFRRRFDGALFGVWFGFTLDGFLVGREFDDGAG